MEDQHKDAGGDRYTHGNRCKHNLQVHIISATKYRKKVLTECVVETIKRCCCLLAEQKKWDIVAIETDKDHVHILLRYAPTETISSIVAAIKQHTTWCAWQSHANLLSRHYWGGKRILWSDGYFACSTGEVSSETIRRYIETQG